MLLLFTTLLAIEFFLSPRFDKTEEGWILWYGGKDNRKYVKL